VNSLLIDGHWLAVKRTDPRAFGLYRRHYSAKKNAACRRRGNTNVTGSGETMVLLSRSCDALFVWLHNTVKRLDGQAGVCCAVFRNDGRGKHRVLSSALIREADELAWQRWPGYRLFTYVDPAEVRSVQVMGKKPGQCFLEAGWRECGVSAEGKVLFEILPDTALEAAS
jgi:hypothetical protein